MFKHFLWDFLGKISSQLAAFILSIILTRILTPEHYGLMGMAFVIISISTIFLDLGFSRSLIQQKEINALQYSTVFYLNLILGGILCIVCFSSAGIVADFYDQPLIRPVFRALSFLFIINALNIVPSSRLYREMRFKSITIINLIATSIGGLFGVILAYKGYGVWSLVAQSLITALIVLLINLLYTRFTPLLRFSFPSIRPLWSYGSRLFLSGFLDVIFTRLDVFLIGKLFSPATLGFYTRAQSMDIFVRQFSSGSIASVMFSYVSKHQNEITHIRAQYIKYLHLISIGSIFLSGILFLTASEVFVFLFSERWKYAGDIFQLMAIASFVWPISNLMCTVIAGLGFSKMFLRLEIYKKLFFIPVYIIGFYWGLEIFVMMMMAAYYLSLILNILFTKRALAVDFLRQFKIIAVYLLICVGATLVTSLFFSYINLGDSLVIDIFCKASLFTTLFILSCYFIKAPGFVYVREFIRRKK